MPRHRGSRLAALLHSWENRSSGSENIRHRTTSLKRSVNDRYRSSKRIDSLETKHAQIISMQSPARYLIVDGHSVIFAWPELRKLHARRSSLAREALVKQLRDYQDWTGVHVVVVFDGKGKKVEATSEPADVQIFYSRSGQSADAIIERLASKYAKRYELVVATSDSLEAETVHACGAESISAEGLRGLIADARR